MFSSAGMLLEETPGLVEKGWVPWCGGLRLAGDGALSACLARGAGLIAVGLLVGPPVGRGFVTDSSSQRLRRGPEGWRYRRLCPASGWEGGTEGLEAAHQRMPRRALPPGVCLVQSRDLSQLGDHLPRLLFSLGARRSSSYHDSP